MHNFDLPHSALRRIDLNLLVAFDALMQERHVSRAAQRLNLGQPAMSHALARLRELLHDPLFFRIGTQMEPTARAIELAPQIHTWLEQANQFLLQEPLFNPAQAQGTFSLSTPDGLEAMAEVDARLTREKFTVAKRLGPRQYKTAIDADLIIFSPNQETKPIYMVSIKSTLKDRFHNVPFWNLLRSLATNDTVQDITAEHRSFLRNVKYISICTDLAEEQPDFAAETGPRNMLCFDAALLDGAYVTASRANGVSASENCIGLERDAPFHRLSAFLAKLS